jgi:hypothetical protein
MQVNDKLRVLAALTSSKAAHKSPRSVALYTCRDFRRQDWDFPFLDFSPYAAHHVWRHASVRERPHQRRRACGPLFLHLGDGKWLVCRQVNDDDGDSGQRGGDGGDGGSSSLFTKARWGGGRLIRLGYKQLQLGYATDYSAESLSIKQSQLETTSLWVLGKFSDWWKSSLTAILVVLCGRKLNVASQKKVKSISACGDD